MLEPNIMAQLSKIMGKDAVLTSKEDLTTYSYDGTARLKIWLQGWHVNC
jgi:hypothetical protein